MALDSNARARDILVGAALEAGEIALRFFREAAATSARIDYKEGGSPVTEADLAVDDFLRRRLGEAFPDAGWLSEETTDGAERLRRAALLIVDPIDGTRAFIAGDPRWAVSIAYVRDGRPIAAVVSLPALGRAYGAAAGCGATLNGAPIAVSTAAGLDGARAAGPKPLLEQLARAAGAVFVPQPRIPSLAYRLALVASGDFEIAAAAGMSHDWDVAAADLVIEEAGGRLSGLDGAALLYNRPDPRRAALLAAPAALSAALAAKLRMAANRAAA